MAIEPRGELDIILGGKTYPMALTFRALAQLENKTGLGSIALVKRMAELDFKTEEVASVIWAGINACRSQKEQLDLDDVGNMVLAEGLVAVSRQVGRLLMRTLVPEGKVPADGAE